MEPKNHPISKGKSFYPTLDFQVLLLFLRGGNIIRPHPPLFANALTVQKLVPLDTSSGVVLKIHPPVSRFPLWDGGWDGLLNPIGTTMFAKPFVLFGICDTTSRLRTIPEMMALDRPSLGSLKLFLFLLKS